jgi:hypothetical protein
VLGNGFFSSKQAKELHSINKCRSILFADCATKLLRKTRLNLGGWDNGTSKMH